jgi:hypothetical protein
MVFTIALIAGLIGGGIFYSKLEKRLTPWEIKERDALRQLKGTGCEILSSHRQISRSAVAVR